MKWDDSTRLAEKERDLNKWIDDCDDDGDVNYGVENNFLHFQRESSPRESGEAKQLLCQYFGVEYSMCFKLILFSRVESNP